MPILMPDTSEAMDFDPSEPGTYLATIVKVDPVVGKEKGTKGIEPTFEFMAPLEGTDKQRKVQRKSWLAIEGKGSSGFDQLLRATNNGDLADKIKENPGAVPFDTDDILNKQVNVILATGIFRPKDGGQERKQDDLKGFLRV